MKFKPLDEVKILPIYESQAIVTCCLLYADGWRYEVRFWKDCEVKFQMCLENELELLKNNLTEM